MQVTTSKHTITFVDEILAKHLSQVVNSKKRLDAGDFNEIDMTIECATIVTQSIGAITDKVKIKELYENMNMADITLIKPAVEQLLTQSESEEVKKN